MNDRALRHVVVGMGKGNGPLRETAFDITAASEVMAILCLATSAKDLEARLGRIIVGTTPRQARARERPRRLRGDDRAAPRRPHAQPRADPRGDPRHRARRALRQHRPRVQLHPRDAPRARLRRTTSSPRRASASTSARRSSSTSSAGWAGSGRAAWCWSRRTARSRCTAASPWRARGDPTAAPSKGLEHLGKHLETLRFYGLPAVVAVNGFPQDTDDERGGAAGVRRAQRASPWPAARASRAAATARSSSPTPPRCSRRLGRRPADAAKYTYELGDPPEEKIRKIARTVYGADDVTFTASARKDLDAAVQLGGAELPVCMAKTHLSLSDDPTKPGRPRGFTINVREVRLSAGAGYLVALTGEIMTMPGLPRRARRGARRGARRRRVTGLMQGESPRRAASPSRGPARRARTPSRRARASPPGRGAGAGPRR
jgi:formate--tetrahydrofolate ligase